MKPIAHLCLALVLLVFAFIVFRRLVRRDYLVLGHLSKLASGMQLLVFIGYFSFPYLFNPPEWPWFWRLDGPSSLALQITGLALICIGFLVAFGTMLWFGMTREFGRDVT